VSSNRLATPVVVLAALVLGALILVVLELANGAAGRVAPALARPCEPRAPFQGGGITGTVQRVVLEGLDGASCRLHTTREELVLSVSPSSRSRRWSRRKVEVAIRAGLDHAIDAEERQGNIPGFLVQPLHRIVEKTPFEQLIRGAVSLGSLLP
jgi:hypothetical protein